MQKLNNDQFNIFVDEYVRLDDIYNRGVYEQIENENKNESNIYLDKSLLFIYGRMLETIKIFDKLTGFDLCQNTGNKLKIEKLRQKVVELKNFEKKESLTKELEELKKERNTNIEIKKTLLSEYKYKTKHKIDEWEQLEIKENVSSVDEVHKKIEIYNEVLKNVDKQIEIIESVLKE